MARASSMKPDPDIQKEGKWFSYNEENGPDVLLAHFGDLRYQRKLTRLGLTRRNRTGELPTEVINEAMFGTVVRDWKRLEDDNDNPIPFTLDNLLKEFETNFELRTFCQTKANDVTNFQRKPNTVEEVTEEGELPPDRADLKSGV